MLEPQTSARFIGREQELRIYEAWLADPTAPWILYFHDALIEPEKKGGIGKTWLLRKCIERTQELHPECVIIATDFFNIDDRQGISIARRVIERLQEYNREWSPQTSLELFEKYNSMALEGAEMADLSNRLSAALADDLRALDRQLQRTGRYVLLFFDTFELIEKNPVIASLGSSYVFPDHYQFEHIGAMMAGRNAIDWKHPNWAGRENEVQSVAVAPFSPGEMISYMISRDCDVLDVNSREAWQLYERTEGRPILIGLVTDVLSFQATNLEELLTIPSHAFEARLVAKINDLVNPINWFILFMAHAYHRFNTTLLDRMLQNANLQTLVHPTEHQKNLEKLLELSFIRRSSTGDDFVLHDEMRRLVLKYCWSIQDTNRHYRLALSRSAISYYENELASEARNDSLTQTYTIEMLYHKLFLDLESGLQELETLFSEAQTFWLTGYARSLLQETEYFTEELTPDQRYRLILLEAALLKQEENPDAALVLYQQLEHEASADWLAVYQAELFYGLGDCYLDLSRFSEAVAYLTRSQEIEKQRGNVEKSADILGLLGYICRRQGEQENAVRYYKESIEGYKSVDNRREYANILNSLGYVYRLQGKMEDALRYCKMGLRIREDLFKEGKVSHVSVGISHGTLGVVYHYDQKIDQAEEHFQRAFEIYRQAGNKRLTLLIYTRFGQIEMSRGHLKKAQEWFQMVEDSPHGADLEVQTINLIRQGLLFIRMARYEDAIERFKQAYVTATKMHDFFQIAEALIDRARAMTLAGNHEESETYLNQGIEIARQYRFYALLGTTENILASASFQARDYPAAFTHYAQSCHYSALYNAVRFRTVMRELNDIMLNNLPISELPASIAILRHYWKAQRLEEIYPDFLNMLETLELMPDFPS